MPPKKPDEAAIEEYKRDIAVYKGYTDRISVLENERKSQEGKGLLFLIYAALCVLIFFPIYYFTGQRSFWGSLVVAIYPVATIAYLILRDFLINIVTAGKFNRLRKEIMEINALRNALRNKIEPFEREASNYLEGALADYFANNLYKKRSGSASFGDALSEFASMLEKLSNISSRFITAHIPKATIQEYELYLIKRQWQHQSNFRSSISNKQVVSVDKFIEDVTKRKELKKEVIAPEKLYRVARKIDNWEEINKKRKITGLRGEEIAVAMEQEFFESIDRNDLAEKVCHVSTEQGDGLGYDILSFFADGREKYIEVKSTTTSLNSSYYLSRNELTFLREHLEDAFIYRVLVTADIPQMEAYSSSEVLKLNDVIPVQYMVRAK